MRLGLLLLVLFLFSSILYAGELQVVSAPTAEVLQKGEYQVFSKIYRQDGVLVGANVGLFPNFMFGVSYGGEHIVGQVEPDWHSKVDFIAKFKLFEEGKYPALSIGYDSQGHGVWHDGSDRYDIKSKGFYLAASKSDFLLPKLICHAGINLSLENSDGDRDPDIYIAANRKINDILTIESEYDLALNDNDKLHNNYGEDINGLGRGYLNLGASLLLTHDLELKLYLYDILNNNPNLSQQPHRSGIDRAIYLQYTTRF